MDALKAGDPRARGQFPQRGNRINDLPGCDAAFVLPDSIAVIARPEARTWLFTWQPFESEGIKPYWRPLDVPVSRVDTLRGQVVDVRCTHDAFLGNGMSQVLAERDGYTFGVDAYTIIHERSSATMTAAPPMPLMVIGAGGVLDTALLRHGCPGYASTECYLVTGLRPFRDSVALADRIARDSAARAAHLADLAAARARAEDSVRAAREDAAAAAARETLIRSKGWPASVTAAVLARKVAPGMTRAMVQLSWGNPIDFHVIVSPAGRFEQWVYGPRTDVYFQDGIVVVMAR